MLVSFSVANFRSFGTEVTLNMVASNKLQDHCNHRIPIGQTGENVLRTAMIYGGNAAGKSNFVRSMFTAQRLIKEVERPQHLAPFRFSSSSPSQDDPTSFEFRFLVSGKVFVYGFDVLRNSIASEWLSVVKGDDEHTIFERDGAGKTVVDTKAPNLFPDEHTSFRSLFALEQIQVRQDQLFLSRLTSIPENAQGVVLRDIIKWLTIDLVILPSVFRSSDTFDRLFDDNTFRTFCSTFLNNVGTGIGKLDFALIEREGTEYERRIVAQAIKQGSRSGLLYGDNDTSVVPKDDKPGYVIVRKLLSEHHIASKKYYLPFAEESDGTQSLLHLLPFLAAPADENRVIVVDELDRSLHPLICWEFVRFFSESCAGSPRQLIATTHEAHLLNQELLRRDEYWFAEKDDLQQTQLTSLMDFKIRKDLQIERGYLAGRFGGIPIIGGMHDLERLLGCHESEDADAKETPAS